MYKGRFEMDRTSVIGVILGCLAIGIGMIMKGVTFDALINPAAILIIIIGTAASVIIAFQTRVIKNVPSLFVVLFTEKEDIDVKELIDKFIHWAEQTRKEGLLSLEGEMADIDDPFLLSGLQMAVDGQNPDFI